MRSRHHSVKVMDMPRLPRLMLSLPRCLHPLAVSCGLPSREPTYDDCLQYSTRSWPAIGGIAGKRDLPWPTRQASASRHSLG